MRFFKSIFLILASVLFFYPSSGQDRSGISFISYDECPWKNDHVKNFEIAQSGKYYILTYESGLFENSFNEWKKMLTPDVKDLRGIILDKEDNLYLYTGSKIYLHIIDQWKEFPVSFDLPAKARLNFVNVRFDNALVFQYTNNTQAGLIYFLNGEWKKLTAFEEYAFVSTISGFEQAGSGNIYFGMNGAEGVYSISDIGLTKCNNKNEDPIYSVRDLELDASESVWVVLDYRLSSTFDPTRPQVLRMSEGKWENTGPLHDDSNLPVPANDLVVDVFGKVWVAGRTGVYSYDGKFWEQFDLSEETDTGRFYLLRVDPLNRLWCICENGILTFSAN